MIDRTRGEAAADGEPGSVRPRRPRWSCGAWRSSGDGDRDSGRVGEDVEDGRALLRLRDQGLDLGRRRVGVDPVVDRTPLKPLRTSGSAPRMPCRSISALTEAWTDRSWICRCCATAAMPAVRQPPSATSTYSTGVIPLSCAANCSGWSMSKANVLLCGCSSPKPKKVWTSERLCVPLHPGHRGTPLEPGDLRCVGERLPGPEQRLDVHPVVDE